MKIQEQVRTQCFHCKQMVTLPISNSDLTKFRKSGKLIQNFFPKLTPGEREILISGICGKCFDKMFPEGFAEV